ncbi:MAG TPA: bifunctional transaldolase/phosoglucose isomerase [Pyrinomonadaceae bacterium]|nr:bifunctional transaldolase/phosoglucose isomerase [Pyrinomonadaceae bacterium]HMP65916.1 bifunctional transaldolase/phosoglucose isomerase [Pyrinomonadaceae bacterium]
MPDHSFTFSLPDALNSALSDELAAWQADGTVNRIWQKDADVWTGSGEDRWLGWLDIVDRELGDLKKYEELKEDVRDAGFQDILLMGMGGSSLCPEVLAHTFGKTNFHILDSTVPAQVKTVESRLDLSKTLFIVASKSGTTLEPNCFKQYFFERVAEFVGKESAGRQFIAITDPGSKMEEVAREDGFRHIIFGEPTVGGRFSALSPFGMTAAAAMGLDVKRLLSSGSEVAELYRRDVASRNVGVVLGLILGVCHRAGRDKLTIFTSPEISRLGAWLEQLIAESTGKNGVAIIPVDGEPPQPAVSYGSDRVFVQVRLAGSDIPIDLAALHAAGHPVIDIELADRYSLGGEFFRWEFATAVAGAAMGINPFDQPDVESAKIEARKITDQFEASGELPAEQPFFEEAGFKLFSSEAYASRLMEMVDEPRISELLSAHCSNIDDGDYFAVLAYLEMNQENEELLKRIRARTLEQRLAATCLGFGPRFLHSTGQAYKGGANNGVFLQITSDDTEDLAVPGQKFTFGVVKAAQSLGDLQVLLDRGRRALRVHIGADVAEGLKTLCRNYGC